MKLQPLPEFPSITLRDIAPASTLLFYGGNKITSWYANKRYNHPYKPGAFHAALYLKDGLSLNVGKFKAITDVATQYRSTYRIDVITYLDLTPEQREAVVKQGLLDADEPHVGFNLPTYGLFDFLRFEPVLRKLLPEDKRDICSENVTREFGQADYTVSKKPAAQTAPWDLFEYALSRPEVCKLNTLWKGLDFKP